MSAWLLVISIVLALSPNLSRAIIQKKDEVQERLFKGPINIAWNVGGYFPERPKFIFPNRPHLPGLPGPLPPPTLLPGPLPPPISVPIALPALPPSYLPPRPSIPVMPPALPVRPPALPPPASSYPSTEIRPNSEIPFLTSHPIPSEDECPQSDPCGERPWKQPSLILNMCKTYGALTGGGRSIKVIPDPEMPCRYWIYFYAPGFNDNYGPAHPYSIEDESIPSLGCSRRDRTERRLTPLAVDDSLYAPNLQDCERACIEARRFYCRSFSYSASGGYSRNDNCELSGRDAREFRTGSDMEFAQGFDLYERFDDRYCIGSMMPGSNPYFVDDHSSDSSLSNSGSYGGGYSGNRYEGSYNGGSYSSGSHGMGSYGGSHSYPGGNMYNKNGYGYGEDMDSGMNYNGDSCFKRFRTAARMKGARRFVDTSSLQQCRMECMNNRRFVCKAFNFRMRTNRRNDLYSSCELLDRDTRNAQFNMGFIDDRDYDYYEWASGRDCSRYGGIGIGSRNQYTTGDGYMTVSGQKCIDEGCRQDQNAGYYFCEVGSKGAWDYCCNPTSQCDYHTNEIPWCSVGTESRSQWRPCSELYFKMRRTFGDIQSKRRFPFSPLYSHQNDTTVKLVGKKTDVKLSEGTPLGDHSGPVILGYTEHSVEPQSTTPISVTENDSSDKIDSSETSDPFIDKHYSASASESEIVARPHLPWQSSWPASIKPVRPVFIKNKLVLPIDERELIDEEEASGKTPTSDLFAALDIPTLFKPSELDTKENRYLHSQYIPRDFRFDPSLARTIQLYDTSEVKASVAEKTKIKPRQVT